MRHTLLVKTSSLSAIFAALIATGHAGSATWDENPTSNDWNTAANWTPETVPNSETDMATFGASSVTDVSVSALTYVDSIVFDSDASAYTFTIQPMVVTLELWGSGAINNSSYEQTFIVQGGEQNGALLFRNSASAGDRITYDVPYGYILFAESSSAGSATFNIGPGGSLALSAQSTAANAIINTSGYGYLYTEGGTAADAFITNGPEGMTDLGGPANNATIANLGSTKRGEQAGFTSFDSAASGDNAVISNYAATAEGGQGGYTDYGTNDLSATATVTNYGSAFGGDSAGKTYIYGDAGAATLISHGGTKDGAGGAILLAENGDGNTARVELDGNGSLDVSMRFPPHTEIGSVEGDGEVFLGDDNLNVGTNNLNTQLDGIIQDGGRYHLTGGSLSKVGTGTLTLTGANTYTGGTTVSRGALRINNSEGSGTGTGSVVVAAGMLGGRGTISGAVVLGTGAGPGASVQPGLGASTPTTLTIQSTLTFKSDSAYGWKLNTKKAKADQLLAMGVTIESGAQFDLQTVANKKLTAGISFVVISNTSSTPISGTFANLPDGGTITAGPNTLQASYEGGGGNDLTLTVVP